jgi:hypothetical protein
MKQDVLRVKFQLSGPEHVLIMLKVGVIIPTVSFGVGSHKDWKNFAHARSKTSPRDSSRHIDAFGLETPTKAFVTDISPLAG